jgi:hypothetical protein
MLGATAWVIWACYSALTESWTDRWDQWLAATFFTVLGYHVARLIYLLWNEGGQRAKARLLANLHDVWNPPWKVSQVLQIVMCSMTAVFLFIGAMILVGHFWIHVGHDR